MTGVQMIGRKLAHYEIAEKLGEGGNGKTRVTTQTGTNSKGESVNHTMFYERQ